MSSRSTVILRWWQDCHCQRKPKLWNVHVLLVDVRGAHLGVWVTFNYTLVWLLFSVLYYGLPFWLCALAIAIAIAAASTCSWRVLYYLGILLVLLPSQHSSSTHFSIACFFCFVCFFFFLLSAASLNANGHVAAATDHLVFRHFLSAHCIPWIQHPCKSLACRL